MSLSPLRSPLVALLRARRAPREPLGSESTLTPARPRRNAARVPCAHPAHRARSLTMAAPQSPESLFLDNLSLIERLAGAVARRQGIRGAEVDDFVSGVKLRLVEDDYAVLRKFRGESTLATYLAVVIAMLAREQRVQQLGRWRPSAVARQLGPLAVR